MPIPKLRKDGWLPVGIHVCTIEEIGKHFGYFKRTDKRIRLFEKLIELLKNAKATGFIKEALIDGSFISNKNEPGDIDLILVLNTDVFANAEIELTPFDYNALSKKRLKKKYDFDVFVDIEESNNYKEHIDLYCNIKESDRRKGILKVKL